MKYVCSYSLRLCVKDSYIYDSSSVDIGLIYHRCSTVVSLHTCVVDIHCQTCHWVIYKKTQCK